MPGMTGDQLTAQVVAVRPGLPIVICSGYSSNLNSEQVPRTGVFAVLQKPLARNTLLLQVARALDEKGALETP